MKMHHVIGLSMLAGIALGAAAMQGLHAQAKPPVYTVADQYNKYGRPHEGICPPGAGIQQEKRGKTSCCEREDNPA